MNVPRQRRYPYRPIVRPVTSHFTVPRFGWEEVVASETKRLRLNEGGIIPTGVQVYIGEQGHEFVTPNASVTRMQLQTPGAQRLSRIRLRSLAKR